MDKGLFIPNEILAIEELSDKECWVLAVYWYYTVNGDLHCCKLPNKEVCKKVRLNDDRRLRRIKQHLKDLGLIKTNGGITVTYIGKKNIDETDKC